MSPFHDQRPARTVETGRESAEALRSRNAAAFVNGELEGAALRGFIIALETDRALRTEVIELRCQSTQPGKISERAHEVLRRMLDEFSRGLSFFPGARGIEERITDPGLTEVREAAFGKAVTAADELLELGELPDLAYENRWRALQNIEEARTIVERTAAGRTIANPFEKCLQPATLPATPYFKRSLSSLLNDLIFDPSATANIPLRLHELWGGSHGFSVWELETPAKDLELDARAYRAVEGSPNLRAELGAFIDAAIASSDPSSESLAKIVGAKLLIRYAAEHKDQAALGSVRRCLSRLIDKAQEEPLPDFTHKLAEGMTMSLVLAGDSNDTLWECVREDILSRVKRGQFGCPQSDSHGSGADMTLIESLARARRRLASNDELQSVMVQIAHGDDIPARFQSLRALRGLPPAMALSELLFQAATAKDVRLGGSMFLDDEYPTNLMAVQLLLQLAKEEKEPVVATKFDGAKICPQLAGTSTAVEALKTLYLAGCAEKKRQEWDSGALALLLNALYVLDSDQGIPLIEAHFKRGPVNIVAQQAFTSVLSDHGLRQFVPALIDQIASRNLEYEAIRSSLLLLHEWGYERSQIGAMLGERKITREVGGRFLDILHDYHVPVSVKTFKVALKSRFADGANRIVRLVREPCTQLELEAEHVGLMVRQLGTFDEALLGDESFRPPLAVAAFHTMKAWLQGPSAKLVSREIDSQVNVFESVKDRIESEARKLTALKLLQEFRDQQNRRHVPDRPQISDALAYDYFLTVTRPHPTVVGIFLRSIVAPTSPDFSIEERAARKYCELFLGDNFEGVCQEISKMTADIEVARRQVNKYGDSRELIAEASDYRYPAERPLQEIGTAATGLMCLEIPKETRIFEVLEQDFTRARATFDRFREQNIEPRYLRGLVGGLVRLGKLEEAGRYLVKYPHSDFGALYGIITVSAECAREAAGVPGSNQGGRPYILFARKCAAMLPKFERGPVLELIKAAEAELP